MSDTLIPVSSGAKAHTLIDRATLLAPQRLDVGTAHEARDSVLTDALAGFPQVPPDTRTAVAASAK